MCSKDDFYTLCEFCDDNLNLVAKVIQSVKKPHHRLSRIEKSLENLWLMEYQSTINSLLDRPYKELKTIIEFKRLGL